MSDQAPRSSLSGWSAHTRELVLGVAGLLVTAQLGLRAWALFQSWYYNDDFRLLWDAGHSRLTASYLLDPHDSQFMPVGRLLAWLVATPGSLDWPQTVALTLILQLLASLGCLWMLVTVFGARWGILGPLCLYLFGAMTMPSLMWWAASVNALPLQVVFFAAVALWMTYLRERRWRWLAATLVMVAIGLAAYVKALFVLPVLAYLLLAYFSSGRPTSRLWHGLRRYWPAALAAVVLGSAFLAFYLTAVPQIVGRERGQSAELAGNMLEESLVVGIVGGPWRWDTSSAPVALADPPTWAVILAWLLVVVAALYVALRRRRTGRAWVLLAGYALASYVLLLMSRAETVGPGAGSEYRYLADAACVLALCVGLATMSVPGAAESSEPRDPPVLLLRVPGQVTVALVVAISVSGVASSVRYARIWHEQNPSTSYFGNAVAGLSGRGQVDLVDQIVPDNLVPGFLFPANTTPRLLPLMVPNVRFPEITSRLVVLDESGVPHRAEIAPAVTGRTGPAPDCGWKIEGGSRTIPLDGATFDFDWWVKIEYLGSTEDTMEVRVGDQTVQAPVRQGLNDVFFQVSGEISSVQIGGLDPDTTVCVETVVVGRPEPGDQL